MPITIYARIGMHDLSSVLEKHVNKTVNISITTQKNSDSDLLIQMARAGSQSLNLSLPR
jgi:chemotaxis protein CheY-P-specific phosphatase CheC